MSELLKIKATIIENPFKTPYYKEGFYIDISTQAIINMNDVFAVEGNDRFTMFAVNKLNPVWYLTETPIDTFWSYYE